MEEILAILERSSTWVILAHERPDGDTLGCGSALFQRGMTLGKRCFWGGADPIPQSHSFLPFSASYSCWHSFPADEMELDENWAIVVLDTSNPQRSIEGLVVPGAPFSIINIDHHGDNSMFGNINWVDEIASSVGEMIFDLFARADWNLTPGEAEALFVAISTDTGFFRFTCTTARTLKTASALISSGADTSLIYGKIFENRTLGGLHLWGAGLSRARLFSSGRICMTFLRNDDFSTTKASKDESENLVNTLLSVSGVFVALLLQEENGYCRASIRTRSPANAREIAEIWGGGGHKRAAGCKIKGTLSDAERDFVCKAGVIDEAWFSGN
ncbi:MAG: bifunctional oligoribonuclease/PAP phosphatase NrnA [Thermovirgaceae bacterium]|nr:bifunctional oligoribonuclease/PAP phosphatase NrnA [Thermovirgaceae bacterium]